MIEEISETLITTSRAFFENFQFFLSSFVSVLFKIVINIGRKIKRHLQRIIQIQIHDPLW